MQIEKSYVQKHGFQWISIQHIHVILLIVPTHFNFIFYINNGLVDNDVIIHKLQKEWRATIIKWSTPCWSSQNHTMYNTTPWIFLCSTLHILPTALLGYTGRVDAGDLIHWGQWSVSQVSCDGDACFVELNINLSCMSWHFHTAAQNSVFKKHSPIQTVWGLWDLHS